VAETVTIDALGHAGDGIVSAGRRLFVPFTLPGETVEIERQGERGRLLRILAPSPSRIDPLCRHFGACGGCALQHMEVEAYLGWKRDNVVRAFAQQGIEAPIEPMVPILPASRRRAVFSAIRTAQGIVLGFHRKSAKEIVALAECPILVPAITRRLDLIRDIAALFIRPGKPARIVVVAADNGLDIAFEAAGRLDPRALGKLAQLAEAGDIARISAGGQEIILKRRPEIRSGDVLLAPVPGGFLQAAAPAEAVMAKAVLAHVGTATPVLDLFAGIGTFSLRLARKAPVTAVEGDAALLAAVEEACRHMTGLKPVTVRKRDLFHNPMAAVELNAFGAVVFDPPAAGAKSQAETIARSTVRKVVAVSCNPATLARDARILIDGGYRLERVLPVDQFLFSAEIEAVATFVR